MIGSIIIERMPSQMNSATQPRGKMLQRLKAEAPGSGKKEGRKIFLEVLKNAKKT